MRRHLRDVTRRPAAGPRVARVLLALVALPLTLGLSGCVMGAADIAAEVDAVAWELRPLHLEPEIELHFGRAVLGLASTAARWSDDLDAEFAADVLDEVDRVHVGIYELEGHRRDAPRDLGLDAREELADMGWRVLVRTRDMGESHWVFVRPGVRRGYEMLVVGLEGRELVVAKLEGDLAGMIDHAVRREDRIVVMARDARDS